MKITFQATGIIKLISENEVEEFAIDTWIEENNVKPDVAIADHEWKSAKVECGDTSKDKEIRELKAMIAEKTSELNLIKSAIESGNPYKEKQILKWDERDVKC